MQFNSGLLLLLAPAALAIPASVVADIEAPVDAAIEARQWCKLKCGPFCFAKVQLDNALNTGVSYYKSGKHAGDSPFPRPFANSEGFKFSVAGPYQEFPLTLSSVFNGGDAGYFRIIFNTKGEQAGELTYVNNSGELGDKLLACVAQ